jgi:hypothetical protein
LCITKERKRERRKKGNRSTQTATKITLAFQRTVEGKTIGNPLPHPKSPACNLSAHLQSIPCQLGKLSGYSVVQVGGFKECETLKGGTGGPGSSWV